MIFTDINISSIIDIVKKIFKKIMTTRQTGGLNKGYKPTSPASA
ncbi:hypothetical protein ACYKLA_01670 [Streptococcus suis]